LTDLVADIKGGLRWLGGATAPRLTASVLAARSRAHSHRLLKEWGYDRLGAELVAHVGDRVLSGPFAGLTLTPATRAEHIAPFLLGVYESELDQAWAIALDRSYAQIVDVGAKFGYYAVGLARRYPSTPVVAFDIDRWARAALEEMRSANGTDNVAVLGFCDHGWMTRHLAAGALIVSDCEGFEDALFPHGGLSVFRDATLIIETHDEAVPGLTDRLRADLAATHQVTLIDQHAPRRAANRSLDFLTPEQRAQAVSEIRLPPTWLFAVPHPARAL
jgi:hypothetical protein